jgi:HD-GYP domain-containing protein (c-di-GMP phosphodiesterase class II)
MVERSPALADIGPYIRAHHERVDGNGYPDGRAGQAIPLIARIVAVCDAFDAMANSRQYRDGMGTERALAILQEHAGSQWDALVVDAAIEVVGRRSPATDWRRLDAVGRATAEHPSDHLVGCDCIPTRMLTARG